VLCITNLGAFFYQKKVPLVAEFGSSELEIKYGIGLKNDLTVFELKRIDTIHKMLSAPSILTNLLCKLVIDKNFQALYYN